MPLTAFGVDLQVDPVPGCKSYKLWSGSFNLLKVHGAEGYTGL